MNRLLNFLFIVRHDYRDPMDGMRAKVMLPFIGATSLLLFGLGLLTILNAFTQTSNRIGRYATLMLVLGWIISLISLRLIQRGYLRHTLILVGLVMGAYVIFDALLSGSMTTGVIFPMVVIYASFAFGTRGTLGSYIFALVVLGGMWIIRSEEMFGTESIDNLGAIILYSGLNLTISTLMLWLFTGSLQRTLLQNTRAIIQTRATAETGQIISRILNMDELLTRTVDLLRDRFALYHVQIFMVDDTREYANLAASTGETGNALLAQGFRVPVGVRTVVGDAVANSDMRYVEDITSTMYRHPELLADTRTELAIPLLTGDTVVGVLDIQSMRPNAFTPEDIQTMRVIANQLSQAIQNAQLFEAQQRSLLQNRRLFLESETNLAEIERLNRQLTGQSWQEYMLERDQSRFGVKLVGPATVPGAVEWTPAMQQAADRQRIVSRDSNGAHILAVPISIRGQAIGAIEVRLTDQQSQVEARNVLQAVAERMAFSLENARLFEEAQQAAQREQEINLITAKLQGLTSIEDVLTTAISTLAQSLNAEQGAIRLVAREDRSS